ncbi:MAG: type II secretion system F family protein [Epsilonproteobacteria bacterium]|nr:type II secretion system F family protein [Campylobacterota bacterium]
MIFFIKKVDKNGKISSYFEEFEDIAEAYDFIEKEGSIPLVIKPVSKPLQPLIHPFIKLNITNEEVIEILENFHIIIKSGIPIQTTIEDLITESKNPSIKKMLKHISVALQQGYSLSYAVEKYKKFFGDVIVSLIKIGEQTGNLETALKKGAEFLKNIENIKKKIKQALIYPAFAFVSISVTLSVWLLYVLPKMISLFKDMDVEIPPTTQALITLSNFLQNNLLYLIFALISVVIFIGYMLKYPNFKYYFDKFLLKIPLLKDFILYFNTAFFAQYIYLTITAGVPLLDGLQTLKENTNNEVFKRAIEDIIEKIKKGYRISDAIKEVDVYPFFMVRMITMGEDSGELENQLKIISDYYYAKIDYMAQNLSKTIEPIMLFVLGGIMAVILLALFGPIYSLIGKIQ